MNAMSEIIETKTCFFCKKGGQITLSDSDFARYSLGGVNVIADTVDADVREQLQSGIHGNCWDNAFGSKEE